MTLTICLAPAHTIAYPNGGGHFWVYLQWALGLRALGCDVIWLEQIDPADPVEETRRNVTILRERLARWDLANALAFTTPAGAAPPGDVATGALDFETAAQADLLLNLWHSLPAEVVRRFRRSALIDTDPGLLQTWMTNGSVKVAPHDVYFTIGETVGTPRALFPDCGVQWIYTPVPVFLPEWPAMPPEGAAAYTTVAHWWGGKFEHDGTTLDRKSTRLNSSHSQISYAVFCLKKKNTAC